MKAVKRVYLAGPMTGYIDFNKPAFHAEAAMLRAAGYEVVNPAEIQLPPGQDSWADYMRADLPLMLTCSTVYLLPGWEASEGASLEHYIAIKLGMDIVLPQIGTPLEA